MIPVAANSWQRNARDAGPALPLLASAFLLAAATIQANWIPVDADVSWLITVCEAVLSGQRLYVDLLEANPPASVWLYLPPVWLAHATGLKPEAVVVGAALAGSLLSLWATVTTASHLSRAPRPSLLAAACGFVLFLLPGGLFAQREHVALMLALPVLTQLAAIADRQRLSLASTSAGGAAAGLLIVIKPHFALVLLLPAVWTLLRTRDVRRLVTPALIAAAIAVIYAAALLLFARDYLRVLPMLADTYLPMRDKPANFLIGPMLLAPALFFALSRLLRARSATQSTILYLGAAGFALAGLIQGKNYLNHALPGMALALVALLLLFGQLGDRSRRRLVGLATFAIAAIQLNATVAIQPLPGLAEAIVRAGPPRPTIMTLGTELSTGHPAVRHARGRWVGSSPALFTAAGARYVGLDRPAARRWYHADLDTFVRDVRTKRPDLLLIEDRSRAWLLKDPAIRAAVSPYHPVARAGDIEVWRRR